jgi:hypothetical protein
MRFVHRLIVGGVLKYKYCTLRGDIASLLFAHGKVACCKQKALIKGRLKRLCSRETRLRILDLKDSKFGLYFAVSVVHLMTEFSGGRCRRSSDGTV